MYRSQVAKNIFQSKVSDIPDFPRKSQKSLTYPRLVPDLSLTSGHPVHVLTMVHHTCINSHTFTRGPLGPPRPTHTRKCFTVRLVFSTLVLNLIDGGWVIGTFVTLPKSVMFLEFEITSFELVAFRINKSLYTFGTEIHKNARY